MKQFNNISTLLHAIRARFAGGWSAICVVLFFVFTIASCDIQPELHLHDGEDINIDLPVVDLDLEVYWDYDLIYGAHYDWESEWYYGWDDYDKDLFGELGYTEPTVFQIRRYYTGNVAYAPHTNRLPDIVYGSHYEAKYNWGFWDLLLWNDIRTLDGVQSLVFDESTSLDYVTAYTNMTMRTARYSPKYNRSFYEPEPLFSAYEQAVDINKDMSGFIYDPEKNAYVKTLNMQLEPITYIYLTQVILHHNNGRISNVEGSANLSGMARSVTVNTGVAGSDAITVNYNVRLKNHCSKHGEDVDIVGGRLLTFGMCNVNPNRIPSSRGDSRGDVTRVDDGQRHYIDLQMQFNNGMDSTFVFDVTDQVQTRYKGGVLTIELDVDTVPIPQRSGGSGFDAVVKDYEDGGTYEFPM